MILFMFDSFLAQILVLFLLYISALRIFFLRAPRIDAAAIVSPFAFLVSVLSFFIWGFSFQLAALAGLSLLFFLTNFRAIIRLSSELYVDHYSIPFVIATLIELAALIVLSIFIIQYRPVRYDVNVFSVQKETKDLSGNFANGFLFDDEISEKVRGKISGRIFVYKPTEKIEWISSKDSIFNKPLEESAVAESADSANVDFTSDQAPLVLFVGSPYASVLNYEPYFMMLAQKGLTVLAADFFPTDMTLFPDYRNSRLFRRAELLRMKFEEEEDFKKIQTQIDDFTKRGYEALSRIAIVNFRKEDGSQRKIYYLTDGLDTESVFSFSDKFVENVVGILQMETIPEYKTSRFGFPEQTDVFLASKLGLKRDSEFFIPRYMAMKTVQRIGSVLPKKIETAKSENESEKVENESDETEAETNESAKNQPINKTNKTNKTDGEKI